MADDPTQGLTDEQMAAGAATPSLSATPPPNADPSEGLTDEQMAAQPPAMPAAFTASPQDGLTDEQMADHAASTPEAETPLATGVREAAHEAVPALGSIPAMVAGAGQGAYYGGEAGLAVAGPPGAAVGAFVGGLGGALVAGGVAGYVLQKASGLIEKALGIDDEAQREANRQANPTASLIGGVAPWALGFRPSAQLALKSRAIMGVAGAGFSAAQQYAETGKVDPEEVAVQGGFMALADKPYGIGKKLVATGEIFAGQPPRTGTNDIPPPPKKNADIGNDTSPPVTDKGSDYKKTKTSTTPPTMGTVDPNTGLDETTLSVLQKSVANAEIKPPTGEEGAVKAPVRKPGINVEAAGNAADQMKEPTDFSEGPVPKEEAPPPGEGEPAPAQAPAPPPKGVKLPPVEEGLSDEQMASKAQPATDETTIPTGAREVKWTDPNLQGQKVETADTGDQISRLVNGTLQLSPKVPESIDVAGKTLNPAEPLTVREHATQAAVDRLQVMKKMTDDAKLRHATNSVGIPAENGWLKEHGYDPDAYQKVMDGIRAGKVAPPVPERPPAAQAAVDAVPPSKAALRVQAKQEAAAREAANAIPLQNKPTTVQPQNRVRPKIDLGMAEPEPEVKVKGRPAKAVPGKEAAQTALDARTDLDQDTRQRMQDVIESNDIPAIKDVLTQMRNKANRTVMEGTNVQVDPKELAAKKGAMDATKSTLDAFPNKANRPPETPTEIAKFRDRLQDMLDHANEKNGGESPLDTYAPREKPAAWELLREARNLLRTKETTPEEAAEFTANEALVRGSLKEDPNATNVLGTRRIESNIEFKGDPQQELYGETRNDIYGARQKAEAEVEKNLTTDEQDAGKTHDLTTDSGIDAFKADTEKLIPNLIAALDKKATQPRWDRSAQEMLENNPALKARRQQSVSLVNREPKEQPVPPKSGTGVSLRAEGKLTDEVVQRALASADKAKAAKTGYVPKNEAGEVADTPTPPAKESLAKRFTKDERGSVNLNLPALDAFIRTRAARVRDVLSKYLGATWNDNQRVTKSVMTQMLTHGQNLNTDMRNFWDADWHRMNETVDEPNFFAYMDTMEKTNTYTDALSGVGPPQFNRDELISEMTRRGVSPELTPYLADKAPIVRDIMDQIFRDDKAYGSTAEYVKNYAAHIFSNKKVNGVSAEEWIQARNEARTETIGSTTHQQERVFDTIKEARKAGYELRYTNIADLVSARYAASVDFHMLVGGLRKLQEMGLATPNDEAKGFQKNWPSLGGKKYIAPDHNTWFIHPDAVPAWVNAENATGLRNMKGPIGSTYRTWMALKNVWVPVELALTAFHPIHVLGINFAENMTGAQHEGFDITHPQPLIKALKDSVTQPFLMLPLDQLPLGLGEKYSQTKMGLAQEAAKNKQMVQWWKKPAAERTPAEQMWQSLSEAGGMLRGQPGEERIISEHAFATSVANKSWKAVPQGLQMVVQKAALGMFTHWIPDLKMAAFQNSASRAFRMDNELVTDTVKRNEVMRQIGSDIHSRYGEMNYKVMGWDPIIKDAGVGSFLSLSWQLGQVNQAAGAARNLIMRAGGKSIAEAGRLLNDAALEAAGKERQGTRLQQTLYKHSTKGAYVINYVASSMMLAGAASYMLSGKPPQGMDYVYPRNGNTNPDGTPGRYTVPFNTREGPMLMGHVTAADSAIQGFKQLVYNKMIIAPVIEMAQNRDAFGNELYSVHSPAYLAALQMMDSELGRRFNPIAVTGAARAKQLGGTAKDTAAAYLGFGPAPAYTEKSDMEAQVGDLYKQHGAPASRPYEVSGTGLVKGIVQGKNLAQQRQDARMAKALAIQQHDTQGEQDANKALLATGESPTAVKKQRPGEDSPYFFSQLPISDQMYLVGEMAKDKQNGVANFQRYVSHNALNLHKKAAGQLMQAFYKQKSNQ